MVDKVYFLQRILKISRTEKKTNLEVLRAAGVPSIQAKTINQRQLDLFDYVFRRKGSKF